MLAGGETFAASWSLRCWRDGMYGRSRMMYSNSLNMKCQMCQKHMVPSAWQRIQQAALKQKLC